MGYFESFLDRKLNKLSSFYDAETLKNNTPFIEERTRYYHVVEGLILRDALNQSLKDLNDKKNA